MIVSRVRHSQPRLARGRSRPTISAAWFRSPGSATRTHGPGDAHPGWGAGPPARERGYRRTTHASVPIVCRFSDSLGRARPAEPAPRRPGVAAAPALAVGGGEGPDDDSLACFQACVRLADLHRMHLAAADGDHLDAGHHSEYALRDAFVRGAEALE